MPDEQLPPRAALLLNCACWHDCIRKRPGRCSHAAAMMGGNIQSQSCIPYPRQLCAAVCRQRMSFMHCRQYDAHCLQIPNSMLDAGGGHRCAAVAGRAWNICERLPGSLLAAGADFSIERCSRRDPSHGRLCGQPGLRRVRQACKRPCMSCHVLV